MHPYKPLMDFDARAKEIADTLSHDPHASLIFAKVIEPVDRRKVVGIQEKYRKDLLEFNPFGNFKYADLPFWIAHKISRVISLGLDKCEPLSILDIGCGGGHFPAVCQALGHQVIGIDIQVHLYDDICDALGVDRRNLPIYRHKPLPELGRKFDLVTAIWISFDSVGSDAQGNRIYWSIEDWEFFLIDMFDHRLNPGGKIYLELNPQYLEGGKTGFNPVLLEGFRRLGATATENGVVRVESRPRTVAPVKLESHAPMQPASAPQHSASFDAMPQTSLSQESSPGEPNHMLQGAACDYRCLIREEPVVAWRPLNRLFSGPTAVLLQPKPEAIRAFFIPGQNTQLNYGTIRVTSDAIAFPGPGEYYFYCQVGAFKALILDPSASSMKKILAIASFVSKNAIHSNGDFGLSLTDKGPWGFDGARLAEKFFLSDQPLQLHCGPLSTVLAMLLNQASIMSRRVWMGNPDRTAGHSVLEAFDSDSKQWILLDPDYGVHLTDEEDNALSGVGARELLPKVRVVDLAGKRWQQEQWNLPLGFAGQATWTPQHDSAQLAADPVVYLRMLAASMRDILYHRYVFSEDGWMSYTRPF